MNKIAYAHASKNDEETKSIHRRSNIWTGIFAIIILLILLYPFFRTELPIPEAEGLMVAFGDNPDAGGPGEFNPTPSAPPPPAPQPIVEKTPEEKTTVEDKNDPIVIKPTEKPQPTPPQPTTPTNNNSTTTTTTPSQQVNTDALFPGGGGGTGTGTGTGSGAGKQGAPDGIGDLGGTGRGNQGNGTGAIGNRHIKQKCTSVLTDTNWDEEGVAWIFICVSEQGKVIEANFQKNTSRGEISTITSQYQRTLAEKCAKEYTYDSALGQGQACGSIPIYFKKQ